MVQATAVLGRPFSAHELSHILDWHSGWLAGELENLVDRGILRRENEESDIIYTPTRPLLFQAARDTVLSADRHAILERVDRS